jgi:hypothetical protein
MWTETIVQFAPNIAVFPLGNGVGLLGPRVYYASGGVYAIDATYSLREYDVVADVDPLFNYSAIPQNFPGPFVPQFVRNTPAGLGNVSAMFEARQTYREFHRQRMLLGSIYCTVGLNPEDDPRNLPTAGTFDLQAP